MNQLFPFFSIIAADYLYSIRSPVARRIFIVLQNSIAYILFLLVILLVVFIQFKSWTIIASLFLILAIITLLFRTQDGKLISAISHSFLAAIVAYGFINLVLYPWLMNFQAGSEAASYINKMNWKEVVYMPARGSQSWSLEFYSKQHVKAIDIDNPIRIDADHQALFFVQSGIYDRLLAKGYKVKILEEFPYYHISQLSGDFLNYKTRVKTLENYKLVMVENNK
jgi:hypothetical protein